LKWKASSFFNIFSFTTSTRNIKLSIIVLENLLLKLLFIVTKVIHNKNWNFCVFLFFILLADSIQNFRGLKYLNDGFRLGLKKRDLKRSVNLLIFSCLFKEGGFPLGFEIFTYSWLPLSAKFVRNIIITGKGIYLIMRFFRKLLF
jgi:hypothetical protein